MIEAQKHSRLCESTIFKNFSFSSSLAADPTPVLKINDHATGGRRTKDILGGPKGWGPKKKVANIEIYVIFEVFAFCGRRTKTDFKDRGPALPLEDCLLNLSDGPALLNEDA